MEQGVIEGAVDQRPEESGKGTWLQFGLFGLLMFLIYFRVSLIGEEFLGRFGRIRLLVAGLLLIAMLGRGYVRMAVEMVLKRESLAACLLMLLLLVSSALVGNWGFFRVQGKIFITFFMLMLWSYMLVQSAADLKRMLVTLAFVAAAAGVASLVLGLLGAEGEPAARLGLGYGTELDDPNDSAYILCWGIALVASMLLRSQGWMRRLGLAILLVLMLLTLIATGSRAGAVVAVVTVLGLLYALRKELKLVRLSLFLILVFVPAAYVLYTGPSVFRGPSQRIYSLKDIPGKIRGRHLSELQKVRSLDTRIPASRAALEIWWENPIWGVGTGSFTGLVQDRVDRPRFPSVSTHNTYLLLLAENGVIGSALYCLLLVFLWMAFRKQYKAPLGVIVLVMATAALATNCGARWHILYIMAGLAAQVRSWQTVVKPA